ncbi:pentapeptide repeat-containing protein, partial [Vannielia sp.]|uniref:pentapeptide repeat-containing protein n=1 Tax=Vannielia sp. TaxID=2813045 RepID=UPI002604B258
MQDTIYTLAQNRLLWIAVAFAVGLGLIAISEPSRRFYRRTPSLLRSHYWKAMLAFGLLLGGAAIVLYLAEIAHAVMGLVDRLVAAIADGSTEANDLRNLATATALLLGTLAVSATLIFQLVRVWITERTTTATEEGLITDRINKALEALGTEKTVTFQARMVNWTETVEGKQVRNGFEQRWGAPVDIRDKLPESLRDKPESELAETIHFGHWTSITETQPNLEVRIGGIYALERIAQDSPRDHVQIMEILCAYIRQNAPASEAAPWPELEMKEGEDDGPLEADRDDRRRAFYEAQEETYRHLTIRDDIQTALTVIGRRSAKQRALEAEANGNKTGFVFDIPCPEPNLPDDEHDPKALNAYEADLEAWKTKLNTYHGYRLDLRKANLRGADMAGLELNGARFDSAVMQGATLREARLQGASLWGAQLQGADLEAARLQGAHLWAAQLQGADLEAARLQGAGLETARLQVADLGEARLQGANLWGARLQGAYLGEARLQGADLGGARLQGATLREARLQGANLWGARLQVATL